MLLHEGPSVTSTVSPSVCVPFDSLFYRLTDKTEIPEFSRFKPKTRKRKWAAIIPFCRQNQQKKGIFRKTPLGFYKTTL